MLSHCHVFKLFGGIEERLFGGPILGILSVTMACLSVFILIPQVWCQEGGCEVGSGAALHFLKSKAELLHM